MKISLSCNICNGPWIKSKTNNKTKWTVFSQNGDFIDQNQVELSVLFHPMAADAGWTHRSRLKCRQWHQDWWTILRQLQSPYEHLKYDWNSSNWTFTFTSTGTYIYIYQFFPTPIWTTVTEIPSSTACLGASSGPIAGTAIGWCMHLSDASKLLHPKEPFLSTPEIQWVGLPPSTMPVGSED
jgi:hypothetical protein